MPCVTVNKIIAAPCEDVFRQAADLAGWADVITAISKVEILTDGGIGKGTRFRETRVMFGKEATEEQEITAFDPPNGFVVEAESCGTHYITQRRFEATEDGGTDVTFVFAGQPVTFTGKVMGAIFSPLMKGMLSKCIAADLEDLKKAVEKT